MEAYGFPSIDDVAGRSRRCAEVGAVPHGTRVTAPIASGHFEGPRLRGRVLPGGGDWTLLRETVSSSSTAHHARDRRRRPHLHDVVRASSRTARSDCGARTRRARRPLDLLLPDYAPLRDRAPGVCVLEIASSPYRAAIGAPKAPSTRSKRSCDSHGRSAKRRSQARRVRDARWMRASAALVPITRRQEDRHAIAPLISFV